LVEQEQEAWFCLFWKSNFKSSCDSLETYWQQSEGFSPSPCCEINLSHPDCR